MAQQAQDSSIFAAVELLKDNGFDALAEAVTVLMNTAMVAERSDYLGARGFYPVFADTSEKLDTGQKECRYGREKEV